jgi:hypothetical protein
VQAMLARDGASGLRLYALSDYNFRLHFFQNEMANLMIYQ